MSDVNENYIKSSSMFLVLLFVSGLLVGGIISFYLAFQQVNDIKSDFLDLEAQFSKIAGFQNITPGNITIYQNITVLSEIYNKVKDSVVLIQAKTDAGTSQGSGFVYNFTNTMYIITNYHVIEGADSVSITFSNGNGYSAIVKGTDPYSDIAIIFAEAPEDEFEPLKIVSYSTMMVGDPVIAIGNPYGLVGSMTTGIISALGRTITEDLTGGFPIANIIQTSAPINPGNSGGPLLNYLGEVIGINTAIVSESQGLGFAIPSDTIIREITSLIRTGVYDGHSYLGVRGTDVNYEIAQQLGLSVTFGWRVVEVTSGGPSEGKIEIADIIVAMNNTRIKNGDNLSSYLEGETYPEETLILTVQRQDKNVDIFLTLGKRPLITP